MENMNEPIEETSEITSDVSDEEIAADTGLSCDVEADSDEDDPEMVCCPLCETLTHISAGKCGNEGCSHVFKLAETGYLIDGFVANEDEVMYEEDGDSCISDDNEAELSDYDSMESDSDDEGDAKKGNDTSAWCDEDSDAEWVP